MCAAWCVVSISIDSRSGLVTLARSVDAVTGQTLNYVLTAKDGANATATALLTINVLDSQAQGPRFSRDQYTATVPELGTDLLPSITVYVSYYSWNSTGPVPREDPFGE